MTTGLDVRACHAQKGNDCSTRMRDSAHKALVGDKAFFWGGRWFVFPLGRVDVRECVCSDGRHYTT